jgi:uncharacterized protein (DUF3084 family)
MPTPAQKQKRAEQARINGAKSNGPATPAGLNKARTAPLQHGLYANEDTLKSTVDPAKFEELRAEYHALWQPANRYIADKVNDLASARWQLDRLLAVRREYNTEVYLDLRSVTDTEFFLSARGNVIERIEARIRRFNIEMSRLERDILRLKKHFQNEGASHKPNKTKPTSPLFHTFSTVTGNQSNLKSEESDQPGQSAPPPSASEPPN